MKEATIVRNDNVISITFGRGFLNSGQKLAFTDLKDVLPFLSELVGLDLMVSRKKPKGRRS